LKLDSGVPSGPQLPQKSYVKSRAALCANGDSPWRWSDSAGHPGSHPL